MSNSPLLQKMICSFEDATSVYIVMHLHGCSLSARMDLAKRCAPIDDVDRAIYMAEMVQAVEDLHALNVIHRDIKPDNFVLTATGNVVLTDFGVAHVFGHSVRELWKAPLWAGTAGYLAPEMDSGKPDGEQRGHGAPADVWSLGMVFIELACGFDQGFFADVRARNGERPLAADEAWAAPPSIDTIRGALAMLPDRLLRDLLLGMLKMDPAERLDIAAIKRHPYFAQIDWETVMAHGYKTDFTPTLEITSLPPPQQHLAQSRIRGATGEPLTCPCFSPMSIVLRPDVPRERVAIDYVIR
ncbi:kinase-like protein [Punctularia strigosozonata HHB-11173 SS5]|uniref:kinase-like protein n=1 Tax=Punctularia strigosozonata (strain HHB-11173) TaxID=741275 RepID=UPI0004417068|nr:kinase-like protein [Punctularia strigosozonata HHB-11173 SS5]EIN08105.1 kinase-like protein [Punctularia strigosozonata HHB-11173 SS5]